MSEDNTIFKCEACDYISKWKCNVIRHMVRKHTASNVCPTASNVCPAAPNVCPTAPNVCPTAPNVCPNVYNDVLPNQCTICNKIFSRRTTLVKHIDKCKGINKLECEYCNIVFTQRCSKSKHLRICKNKKEVDSCALIVHDDTKKDIPIANTVNNITNSNNNSNNNTQNAETINNNITNVIVYDPKNMELLNDHITKNAFRKIIANHDFSKILTDFSSALLGRSENQCVRKTNLLSGSSSVHVGNDKWEFQADKEIYPKLLSNIASNFNDVRDNIKVKICEQLDTFIEDVTCEAEDCHEDKDQELRLKQLHRRTLRNVKHLLFNLTAETLLEKRKLMNKTE